MVDDAGAPDFVMGEGNNGRSIVKTNTLRKSLLDKGIATVIIVEEAPTVAITECGIADVQSIKAKGSDCLRVVFWVPITILLRQALTLSIERLDKPVDILTSPVFTEFQDDALKNERVEDFYTAR